MDYGLTLAGFEHRWLCESDPWRRGLLSVRWPEATVYDDIRTLGDDLEGVDLIAGGFPCKGISGAGRGEGFGHPETVLWREQLRVIRIVRPRYCLIENVAKLLTIHNGACFGEVIGGLAESGYRLWWDVLPAAAVGAPHLRERVFIVAYADSDRGRRPQRDAELGGVSVAHSNGAEPAPDSDLTGRLECGRSLPTAPELEAAQRGALADPPSRSGQGTRAR
jgi:site-specific DNA-cytosine methylase